LHLHFLLRFLMRFSSSDAWERADELRMFWVYVYPHLNQFITHQLVHMHQKKKIAAKIASVNGP
jgi:hypothetical protein